MEKAETWLSKALDYRFKDARLFEQALTHRSATGDNNERLEFLGDAILDLVVSEAIFRARPEAHEGDLSRLRASLVNDASLAALASDLQLGGHLILGSGERKSGGHRRESILADAIEAIFGAVYLDAGFDAAREIIERAFGARLEDFPPVEELRDPKTRLQEWLQARGRGLPKYELIAVTGEAHRQRFEVCCIVDDDAATTRGKGATRRAAEQTSAQRMLTRLERSDTR